MHGACERCGSSRHSDGNCLNPRPLVEDTEGDLRRALVRALDDVKRGNDNISKLLLELQRANAVAQSNAELASAWAMRWAKLRYWASVPSASHVFAKMVDLEGADVIPPLPMVKG
jgi:hypothetical protein